MCGRGIIPARAGFTSENGSRQTNNLDHPRSRGVYYKTRTKDMSTWGSSPLARGLPMNVTRDSLWCGIIPARAGFTAARWIHKRVKRDHPRSRGVYSVLRVVLGGSSGSSPLARGLQVKSIHASVDQRIIPARAGFTLGPSYSNQSMTDHPRSRGVYFEEDSSFVDFLGSSPLARGLPAARPGPER